MEIHYITWGNTPKRWCVVCPELANTRRGRDERINWCIEKGIDVANVGVNFYFAEEKDVMFFRLKWE
jgi:hypothetical protein